MAAPTVSRRACLATAAAFVGTRAAAACDAPAPPQDGRERIAPAADHVDAAGLCAALDAFAAAPANLHGLVVERHGKLVGERYRSGPDRPIDVLYGLANPFAADTAFGPATLHDARSVSKSVVALLFGLPSLQASLPSPGARVLDAFPELADLRATPAAAITVEQLLTMTSGLDWDEGGLPNDETRLFWTADVPRFVLGRRLASTPGAAFHYNSGGTAVLAELVTRAAGRSFVDVVRTELFGPLGITDWQWATDVRDRPLAFTGLRMRPRDMARLGRLVLDGGRAQGRQLVAAEWIAAMLRPRVDTGLRGPASGGASLGYGYQWWAGQVPTPGGPVAWHAGFGNGGQRLAILPALDAVVVITAGAYGSEAINAVVAEVLRDVAAALAG